MRIRLHLKGRTPDYYASTYDVKYDREVGIYRLLFYKSGAADHNKTTKHYNQQVELVEVGGWHTDITQTNCEVDNRGENA